MKLDVLIVDGSGPIRKILHRLLVQAGVRVGHVIEASDGAEAIEKLSHGAVGLILSEIDLPGIGGLELLGRLKSCDTWKSVPVLVITTENNQDKVAQALELGAAGYLRTPFTADQIREKLAGLIT